VAKTNTGTGNATVLDEPAADFYRPPAARGTDTRPSRAASTEADAEEPFLRARRRVPVRRGPFPAWARTRWGMLLFSATVLAGLGAVAILVLAAHNFLDRDPRFRIDSAACIQTLGNSQLTRADVLSVFGADVGRNLFAVPLAKRQAALEQIPWVESATVMRLLPNQLRVAITERTPIAFVEVHGRIALADVNGVILDMAPRQMAARRYSFPVVTGINPGDPLSVRGARMHIYQKFIADLDSNGEHVSGQLSEVDLTDPGDVRASVPAAGSDLLLHFGQEDFLARWHNYQAHIAQWQQQYPHLASIDLRYDREVVLKLAGNPATTPAASSDPAPATPQPSHAASTARPAPVHMPQAAKHTLPAKGHSSGHPPGHPPGRQPAHAPPQPHAGKGAV
jgi:cell division protein FtsQ